MAFKKQDRRDKIKARIREIVSGTAERPRFTVFRSNAKIYGQLIDDVANKTLVSFSSNDKGFKASGNKLDQAKEVGKQLAAKALSAGISSVVFDRNGYLYHGRVKSIADGAREGGLQF
jgi:large subunit ribosomal protein L18